MKNATLPVVLGGISVLLLIIVFLFAGRKDEAGPVIEFTNECVLEFTDEDDFKVLLNGVKAVDKKDGDVSDSLRIQNITVLPDDGKIVVHYSAKDKDNNIVKTEKTYDYTGSKEYIDFSVFDEDIFADDILESDSSSEDITSDEPQSVTDNPSTDETSSAIDESTSIDNSIGEEQTTPQIPVTDVTPIDKAEVDATGIPQIRMKYNELKITVGGNFYFMDALADWYDDKDDVSRRVIVDGTYDVNVPGTYVLRYYVTDSDRNVSNIETLTLIVE